MYGLPGDPNSKRLNRNATETRVHCLWNHLIETASSSTGSLLIWDTGEYEILPYYAPKETSTDEGSGNDSDKSGHIHPQDPTYENEKLIQAFHNRKIRLRLHGTRLPKNYTITLRLSRINDTSQIPLQIKKPRRRGRRKNGRSQRSPTPTPSPPRESADLGTDIDTETDEDTKTRQTNAYPGANNSIGSIHQRKWYISLDRLSSGFIRRKTGPRHHWVPRSTLTSNTGRDGNVEEVSGNGGNGREDVELRGFAPFHVLGPDSERSIITNRSARE
ncbi:MAG: hypothetical protein M4579_006946, partial [Chaenotheca gracillima]